MKAALKTTLSSSSAPGKPKLLDRVLDADGSIPIAAFGELEWDPLRGDPCFNKIVAALEPRLPPNDVPP